MDAAPILVSNSGALPQPAMRAGRPTMISRRISSTACRRTFLIGCAPPSNQCSA
jgi:hypothetical protein